MACTLSCCIVARNEKDKIISCLTPLRALADEIVLVDTGSTDNTIQIAKDYCEKNGMGKRLKVFPVGNKFHDADGDFDFGAAKTHAFNVATAQYVMWLDANDTVSDPKKARQMFVEATDKNKDVYFTFPTVISKTFAFMRARIAPRENATMVGMIHEYLKVNKPNMTKIFVPVDINNVKKARDLSRNLRQLLKVWDREPTARNAFYLGITYHDMKNDDDAIKWLRQRVYTFEFVYNEFTEEYYKCMELICDIMTRELCKPELYDARDLYDLSMKMIEIYKDRMEGYFYLGKYYQSLKDYPKAMEQYNKCKNIKAPSSYKLWVNSAMYNGNLVLAAIEDINTALKYKDVLQPEEILDYGPKSMGIRHGNDQYRALGTTQ